MLKTVFSYRGSDYKGNRIPESFEHLQQAVFKIKEVHLAQSQVNKPKTDAERSEIEHPSHFLITYAISN